MQPENLREFCATVAQQKRNEFNTIKRLSTLFNVSGSRTRKRR
jgi:hypothetical protein